VSATSGSFGFAKRWLCVSGKTKCATCALAEKQKNAGGAKIKSLRIGSCVAQFVAI